MGVLVEGAVVAVVMVVVGAAMDLLGLDPDGARSRVRGRFVPDEGADASSESGLRLFRAFGDGGRVGAALGCCSRTSRLARSSRSSRSWLFVPVDGVNCFCSKQRSEPQSKTLAPVEGWVCPCSGGGKSYMLVRTSVEG